MVDSTFQNNFSVFPAEAEERQNARLTVAEYSLDLEDCKYLLEVLGLLSEPEKYY